MSLRRVWLAGTLSVLLLLPIQSLSSGDVAPDAAQVVRREVLLPNNGPVGRPLPLIAHWHRRSLPLKLQIELIQNGHFILPWVAYDGPFKGRRPQQIDEEAQVRQLREWGLPLSLITGGQWEEIFYRHPDYVKAPAEKTGVAVSAATGKKVKAVSPLSPIEPWRELGRRWTDNPAVKALAEIYPDIPRVFFVSNNEANEMRWHALDKDKYFVDQYGTDKDDEFKRRVLGDGYIARYRALIAGMREGLPNENWKRNSRFIAYNALGPDHFGRPMGFFSSWYKHANTTRDRIDWRPFAWEGAVPESYDNHWEPEKRNWRVWSTQVEMMNGVLLRQEAFRANPEFWHEVIFWNGDINDGGRAKHPSKIAQYAELGVPYTPELYAGWVKHNLWVLTPRVAREWRGSADDKDRWWPYFQAIIDAVGQIHHDPVLVRFWRKGELVANRTRRHPFDEDIPEKWKNVDRWFNLDTSLDPPGTWDLTTELPVMAVARVLGDAGQREWLLYVQATKQAHDAVEIIIPGYGPVRVDARLGGGYFWVKEAGRTVKEVG